MKKGKFVLMGIGFLVLFLAVSSAQSYAGVNIGIGINIPAFRFAAPPEMVVIPGTYVYYAPGADVDILFYQGFWYRPYEGRWYRARAYNGPWAFVESGRVPGALIGLPHDYRHGYAEQRRIPYRDFNRNWKRWEKDRYWEKDERWREGRRHERREGERGEGRGERHDEHRDRDRDRDREGRY